MPEKSYYLPSRRLVSQDGASIIEAPDVPRSKFINHWTHKTTFDAGLLVPILCDEVLPGDHLTYDLTAYVRMSTPLFPIFDNQKVDTFFFFVPNRLVWDNWKKFMGEQKNPDSSIAYTVPQVGTTGGAAVCSTFDYMGVAYVAGNIPGGAIWSVNALPFRAYNLIYNEWFRDENIQNSIPVNTGDGPDTFADYTPVRSRSKAHDYFTSALPWAQKFTAPSIPLAGTAPIIGIGQVGTAPGTGAGAFIQTGGSASTAYTHTNRAELPFVGGTSAGDPIRMGQVESSPGSGIWYPAVYADLAQASGVAINTFRQAFMIQALLERDARGGTRYVELIRSHFKVVNPDFRLQRPEYIGGGSSPLQITPIAQTAPTTNAPLGALGAAGTSAGRHHASYAATEHGFIIGLMNVQTELSYQQGVNRMFNRSTRYDYYWPALAQLGEQAVLRKEIYAQGGSPSADSNVFGYQERWQEYRTRVSEVSGVMRSNASGTLDAWHLSQKFSTAPELNDSFIGELPPMTRILAAGNLSINQQYYADVMIDRVAVRPIPTFGTPALLGRF